MTSTQANTSDTCCAFGSPSASVQGPLCRKRPASPTFTFDSQSTMTPSGKKLCFPAVSSYVKPQASFPGVHRSRHYTDHGLSSLASASFVEGSIDKQLCNSSISCSEQRQSSLTGVEQIPFRSKPAFCSLASACDDNDEGIDEAESRFAAFLAPSLPRHAVHFPSRSEQTHGHTLQSANDTSYGNQDTSFCNSILQQAHSCEDAGVEPYRPVDALQHHQPISQVLYAMSCIRWLVSIS